MKLRSGRDRQRTIPRLIQAFSLGAGLAMIPSTAHATDWSVPHSWRWPLYTRVDQGGTIKTGEPRPAIWNSAGEFQKYSTGTYVHPGTDIRGDNGDPALVPTDGTVEKTFNWTDECLKSGGSCRVWFKTDDGHYLYYVAHVDVAEAPAVGPGNLQVVTEIREQLKNGDAGTGNRNVTKGQKLATLAMFDGTDDGWNHLHLGVIDRLANYVLVDTTHFLEQHPTGETGLSQLIIDDEAPTIQSVELVTDQTQSSAVTTGVCGDEVFASLDIVADMRDTFFTTGTFATFPGLGTLQPFTGIRTARYLVRSLATTLVVAQGTWYDMNQASMLCPVPAPANRSCIPQGVTIDDTLFFTRLALEKGPPSPGLSVLDKLFDVAGSKSNYDQVNGEVYRHILTNANGVEGSWNAAGQPNGRYQVSVETTDFNGNSAAFTRFVTVHNPATTLNVTDPGFSDVFVKDNDNDSGAVPSNLGGQPFWESPDVILVPVNTTVTVDTPSQQTIVAANTEYWLYLRVNNNGCSTISGVKARLFSADPSAISNTWHEITTGGGQYVGDTAHPGGVNVDPGGRAILGPFSWTPTDADAQFGGHRCLLATASAPADTVAAGNEFDAPNQNNVGQRNLQVGHCRYEFSNPTTAPLVVKLTTDATVDVGTETVEVTFDFDATWLNAWANDPTVSVRQVGNGLVVKMLARSVILPPVNLVGGVVQHAVFDLSLPSGTPTRTVRFDPTVNNVPGVGVSCSDSGVSIPR